MIKAAREIYVARKSRSRLSGAPAFYLSLSLSLFLALSQSLTTGCGEIKLPGEATTTAAAGPGDTSVAKGPTGPTGAAGKDGASGETGPAGPAGKDGATGATGLLNESLLDSLYLRLNTLSLMLIGRDFSRDCFRSADGVCYVSLSNLRGASVSMSADYSGLSVKNTSLQDTVFMNSNMVLVNFRGTVGLDFSGATVSPYVVFPDGSVPRVGLSSYACSDRLCSAVARTAPVPQTLVPSDLLVKGYDNDPNSVGLALADQSGGLFYGNLNWDQFVASGFSQYNVYTGQVTTDANVRRYSFLVGPVGTTWYSQTKTFYVDVSKTVSEVDLLARASAVSAGQRHTCAVADGRAYCWGANTYGQLGRAFYDGPGATNGVPTAVDTSGVLLGKTVTAISAGTSSSCALTADGAVYCWGGGNSGQLGDGMIRGSAVPVSVDTTGVLLGKAVTALSSGGSHTCVLAGGAAYCWGDNSGGKLGRGGSESSGVPVAVDTTGVLFGKTVTAVSAGLDSTCAVADGAAYCWGANAYGQLGRGTSGNGTESNVPVAVDTSGVLFGKTVTAATVGSYHACFLTSDGLAACAGWNYFGQLGDGTTTNHSGPTAVAASGVLAGNTLTTISPGEGITCALDGAGAAYCWGLNNRRQLGIGANDYQITEPAAVAAAPGNSSGPFGGKAAATISSGNTHTCAAGQGGGVYCWGNNNEGQLGSLSSGDAPVPQATSTKTSDSYQVIRVEAAGSPPPPT